MKKRNRQEYNFSLRVKEKLEAAGFTVVMMPMAKFRTQLIDMFVMKDGLVLPMEAKGKQSKYLKKHNAEQLAMQKEVFWRSGTPFCRVIQDKHRRIKFELFMPPLPEFNIPSLGKLIPIPPIVKEVKRALKIKEDPEEAVWSYGGAATVKAIKEEDNAQS